MQTLFKTLQDNQISLSTETLHIILTYLLDNKIDKCIMSRKIEWDISADHTSFLCTEWSEVVQVWLTSAGEWWGRPGCRGWPEAGRWWSDTSGQCCCPHHSPLKRGKKELIHQVSRMSQMLCENFILTWDTHLWLFQGIEQYKKDKSC